MPVLDSNDQDLESKVDQTKLLMQKLAKELSTDTLIISDLPEENGFDRFVLAIEDSETMKQGAELVVARWGNNFTSPVHGHADGYLHEDIILGKMMVMNYEIVDHQKRLARPKSMDLIKEGTFVSEYNNPGTIEREHLVHSFRSVGQSISLHYLPEHTRDGLDNGFDVEYFDDFYDISAQVKRITAQEGMYLRPGDVVLVRSENVPEYQNHYIIVTGPPVEKEHGMRIQDIAIPAPKETILRGYENINGLVLLKLLPDAATDFLRFHNYELVDNKIVNLKDLQYA